MVLSDKFGGRPKPSLLRKTLYYVLGFGFGSLALVGVLSLTFVAIAEGLLPGAGAKKESAETSEEDGKTVRPTTSKKPPSKAARGRANDPDESDADEEL